MKRSKFSLSHYKLFSANMGTLTPCGLTEVLPGDTIQHSTSALIRVSPLVAPVMHPVHVRLHHWYVPHRLVWDEFEPFITGGPDGMDDSIFPTMSGGAPGWGESTLADYLGIPPGVPNLEVSALPFRGYAMIYNEWYRDQDLSPELVVSTDSGPDTTTSTALQRVAWEKDYFTSARPWEQKGPAITIPIGTTAPVTGFGFSGNSFTVGATGSNIRDGDGVTKSFGPSYSAGTAVNSWFVKGKTASATSYPDLTADLTNASAVTINILREAFALQRFEEARARYGSRYTEYLRYLGVRSSDARLQRPEYLGGGKQTIQFSEVLQTAEGTDPVGSMAGHGIGAMRSNRYRRFIEEHGYVFTFMSIRPKTIYMQGLPRHWNRRTKEDFWQQELQHIGQQEILNKEIYASHASPNDVFGYQDRYDEYRRTESQVSGEFRNTLDYWHMARDFASAPALNHSFVACVPTDRTFAQTTEDQLYVMANHSMQARRLVSGSASSYIF